MLDKALKKLQDEMDQHPADSYIQFVGNYLKNITQATPGYAEKICASEGTIKGSLEAMSKVASTKKSGSVAVLTPDEGYQVVLKYFGLIPKAKGEPAAQIPSTPAPVEKVKPKGINFDDLFDED